jgi:hypothetical protein
VLLLCNGVDAAVADDRQTGCAVQDDHGVEQQQILDTLVLLSQDRQRRRRGARVL